MKYYFKFVSFILFSVIYFGLILPWIISQPNTELVFVGVTSVFLVYFPLAFLFTKSTLKF